jgi:hypothetical protein
LRPAGTLEDVAKAKESYTGRYLKDGWGVVPEARKIDLPEARKKIAAARGGRGRRRSSAATIYGAGKAHRGRENREGAKPLCSETPLSQIGSTGQEHVT